MKATVLFRAVLFHCPLALLLFSSIFCIAQPIATTDSISAIPYNSVFDELYGKEVIHLRIESNFTKLVKNKNKGKDENATMKVMSGDSILHSYEIEIEARGKSRRKICNFPPMKIKFDKEFLKSRGMAVAFKSLKLVTHCFNNDRGEEYLVKEHLIYKLYNEISPVSFRVQLAKIEYVDSGKRDLSTVRYGFIIEDKDEMAYRYQSKISATYSLKSDTLYAPVYCKMILFQYMVGNTDWKISFLHNIKLIKSFEEERLIPVPYDFDYSGLVDAHYAIPSPDVPIRNVRERCFLGNPDHCPEVWKTTLAEFRGKQDRFIAICNSSPLLNQREKRAIRKYLEVFFKTIKTDKCAKRELVGNNW